MEDDAHDACNEQGLTPLPDIPPLVLPIATQLVSRLLSVAEFLATFSQVLQLKIEPSAGTLYIHMLYIIFMSTFVYMHLHCNWMCT